MRTLTYGSGRGLSGLLVVLALVAALGLPGNSKAQSPFALVNIGADVRQSDARIAGRGGWGLAESDSLNPSFHNLAGLAGLKSTVILYSGFGDLSRSQTPEAERTTSTVRAPNLRIAMPVTKWMALSGGFRALRGTQYKSVAAYLDTLGDGSVTDQFLNEVNIEEIFVREGTQFEVPLGVSIKASSWLKVAASVNLVRGVIRGHLTRVYFPVDSPEEYLPTVEMLEDDLSGTSTTFSMIIQPFPRLSLGATLTPSHNWDIVRTRTMSNVADRSEVPFRVSIPSIWAVGGALDLGGRWRVGGDFEAQDYSKFSGIYWADTMVNSWRVSAGVERRENWKRRGGLTNLPLRFGYTVSRWPYMINNETLEEKWITLGTGVPFRRNSGHMDVALSYGVIGDMDKHGIEDRVWRFSVSMVGLEKWW